MRRALVVAHPDDESLWFGGLLAAEPGNWTVICCSIPRTDPIRAEKFFDACKVLNAHAALIRRVETDTLDISSLDLSDFDQIVTHNSVGEYGHLHHLQLNRHLVAKYGDRVVTGCYGKAPGPKKIALNEHQLGLKLAALRCYDHVSPSDGIPKWRALIDRYGGQFDLAVETYDR
jgi:LmbE family N-acetylglucosaminyl deacetylase